MLLGPVLIFAPEAQAVSGATSWRFDRPSVIRGQPAPSASVPTVIGPIPGTPQTLAAVTGVSAAVLSAFGYQEREFFISGKANGYSFSGTPGENGLWSVTVTPGSTAGYETRIEVFTPTDPGRFSGTVVVEWDNVSAGFDTLPDLIYDHNTAFRNGDAYVAVSAQFVGVESAALNDPDRYGHLAHPGDSYSYDIFSQAGMAIRDDAAKVLGGLRPVALIADGESQSASRLATYIDAFASLFNVYDGYIVHSRGADTSALQQPSGTAFVAVGPNGELAPTPEPDGNVGLSTVNTPPVVQSRTDLLAPVLYFQTQTDVFAPPYGAFNYGPATQPDSTAFRLWEDAGSAHADNCAVNLCGSDTGGVASAITQFGSMLNPSRAFATFPPCSLPLNTGEEDYTLGAAVQQMTTWILTGGAQGGIPADSPPLFAGQTVGEATSPPPVFDPQGNVVGGVRSPAVDVPVATLTGVPTNSPGFCVLSGTTTPLTTAQLQALYPTHFQFALKWTQDVAHLVAARYLTVPDAINLSIAAAVSSVP